MSAVPTLADIAAIESEMAALDLKLVAARRAFAEYYHAKGDTSDQIGARMGLTGARVRGFWKGPIKRKSRAKLVKVLPNRRYKPIWDGASGA